MNDQQDKDLDQSQINLQGLIHTIRKPPVVKESPIEKGLTVRFNAGAYSKVRGLANFSDSSMNTLINELIEVGFGELIKSLSDEERQGLQVEAHAVWNELHAQGGDK